jgi:hypothetical protein
LVVHDASTLMRITVNASALAQTRWYEWALRFLFGGLITALVGIIAKKFGPAIAGLFLAFPAIFPASATLIERHEKRRKEQKGLSGTRRARQAAGADAAGAAMGSIGLLVFACVMWKFLAQYPAWGVIGAATLAWAALSVSVWMIRERR